MLMMNFKILIHKIGFRKKSKKAIYEGSNFGQTVWILYQNHVYKQMTTNQWTRQQREEDI